MAHRPDWRRIKHHRSYTVWEAARATRCHRNTVRAWIKQGLPIVAVRPTLILGADLVQFLKGRSAARKRSCRPGELYCLKCRDAVEPAEQMADFEHQTRKIGRLVSLCPNCGTCIYRFVSVQRFSQAVGSLDVQIKGDHQRIRDTSTPLVNVDSSGTLANGQASS